MRKLLLIVLLLGCEGVYMPEAEPMLSLTGIWKSVFSYYTNTETGKVDTLIYVYPTCPTIVNLDSDSTCTYGQYDDYTDDELDENGVVIGVISVCSENIQYVGTFEQDEDQSYYVVPFTLKWTADEYKIYWYGEIGEADQDSLRAVTDYSLNGDTLIWKSQHRRSIPENIYGDTLYSVKAYLIKDY